jgi:DNA-binding MarR family transcriptional regulator
MTPLQLLILATLYQLGPMRDVGLWQKTTEPALTSVTLACFALEAAGYIEVPRGFRPVSFEWRLTEKGRQYVAGKQQEVTLGS